MVRLCQFSTAQSSKIWVFQHLLDLVAALPGASVPGIDLADTKEAWQFGFRADSSSNYNPCIFGVLTNS